MHYFSGKGCSEFLESMHYCIGILRIVVGIGKWYNVDTEKYINWNFQMR